MGTLATTNAANPLKASIPFDKNSRGHVLSEGIAGVVLTNKPNELYVKSASNFFSPFSVMNFDEGDNLKKSIYQTIQGDLCEVVVSEGDGHIQKDRSELLGIRKSVPNAKIAAPKSNLGHVNSISSLINFIISTQIL